MASLVIVAGASPVRADVWRATDAAGDVVTYTYSFDPPPCGSLTKRDVPADGTTDIVAVSVRHESDAVDLSARFAYLAAWGPQSVSFDIKTEDRAFEVTVTRQRTNGPVWVGLWTQSRETPEPTSAVPTRRARLAGPVRASAHSSIPPWDLVSVNVPRQCLGTPRWVRVGVDTLRFLDCDTARTDVWAPAGTDEAALSIPDGPRVRHSR